MSRKTKLIAVWTLSVIAAWFLLDVLVANELISILTGMACGALILISYLGAATFLIYDVYED